MSDRLGYGEAATLGGTSETQTKITHTDMTTEEKAKAYAEIYLATQLHQEALKKRELQETPTLPEPPKPSPRSG